MKFLIVIFFVPLTLFSQSKEERLKKNKEHVDSLLKRVEKTSLDITKLQRNENKRHTDSLLTVVDRLANSLNENTDQTSVDKSNSIGTDTKQYYIVIGAYANQQLAETNKIWHKFNEAEVIKSRGGKFYYLAIPKQDGAGIQKAVKRYMADNRCDAWWVKL